MAMKVYSAFPKDPLLREPYFQMVLVSYPGHTLGMGSLSLYRNTVSVFYRPSRLGKYIQFSDISKTIAKGLTQMRDTVNVFYNPSRLGCEKIGIDNAFAL